MKLGFLKQVVSGAHAWEDLEKMGALGRTDGDPVSFYVQVIPIGEKPAARAVAVGAKLIRDADGSVSYNWKSLQPSPITPQTPDEPDEDIVNRGIEKGKEGDLDEPSRISLARSNSIQKMTRLITTAPRPNG